MAEFKPIRYVGAKPKEFGPTDTIPAANIPDIDLTTGVTGELPLASLAQDGATDGQSMIWNNTAGEWEPGTPAGGGDVSDGDTLATGLTFPNTGLHILDTNASHDLIIAPGSNLTADRTLTLTTGDASRTLDISAASVTVSAFGATLVDDADAATARATLGVDAAGDVTLTAAPGSNLTASGLKITLTANENQAFGDVCYIGADGDATLANASAYATASALFMCLGTVTAGNPASYLSLGIARNDTWAWTVGANNGFIYLSTTGTTGNTLTQTAPSTPGQVVQVLGVATHADRIYFKPELIQLELS